MNIDTELRWILVVCGTVLLLGIYLWGRRSSRSDVDRRVREDFEFKAPTASPSSKAEVMPEYSTDFAEPVAAEQVEWNDDVPVDELPEIRAHDSDAEEDSRGRREPVLGEDFADDLPPEHATDEVPMLSEPAESESPPPSPQRTGSAASRTDTSVKPSSQRKIVALRLAVDDNGLQGAQLLKLLRVGGLQHGKFGIFHREHPNGSIFSVASMVEPGSFDLSTMEQMQYSGVTMFMLLPGPVDGVEALNEMLSFAQQLQTNTRGVLQDERGKPLTQQTLMRLRDEVVYFEKAIATLAETGLSKAEG